MYYTYVLQSEVDKGFYAGYTMVHGIPQRLQVVLANEKDFFGINVKVVVGKNVSYL